jgi:cellulase
MSFGAEMYSTLFPFYNTVLNFTVDLSTAACACNAAFYATSMPAIDQSGKANATRCGDFYCDANNVCGLWCPEMDIMEANTAAMQITPHKCVEPVNGWYSSCDRDGCGVNTHRQAGAQAYGPGPSFTIDTKRPFTVSTAFHAAPSGNVTDIVTTLTQAGSGSSVVLSHSDSNCGAGYLSSMSTALKTGMVPIFSLWGDTAATMSWLDEPPCSASASCDADTAVMVVSDISLTTIQA